MNIYVYIRIYIQYTRVHTTIPLNIKSDFSRFHIAVTPACNVRRHGNPNQTIRPGAAAVGA